MAEKTSSLPFIGNRKQSTDALTYKHCIF